MSIFNQFNIQKTVSDEKKDEIYLTSELLLKKQGIRHDNIMNLLETMMTENNYYVIHDYELVKGRKKKLLGSVVVAEKKEIISFVMNEIREKDLTEIRILPFQSQNYCICISEHEIGYLYS